MMNYYMGFLQKKYRQKMNLTQKQLAEEINLRLGTYLKHNTISSEKYYKTLQAHRL